MASLLYISLASHFNKFTSNVIVVYDSNCIVLQSLHISHVHAIHCPTTLLLHLNYLPFPPQLSHYYLKFNVTYIIHS